MRPDPRQKTGDAKQQEKAFDALINDLIAQRKVQQEALAKIKASVERPKPGGQKASGSRKKSTSN